MAEHVIQQAMQNVDVHGVPVDRAYWWLDKSSWGPGPWQDEPDKVQFVDRRTGLDCLVVRHGEYGHYCGYVGVPADHPLYKVEPSRIGVGVHGGVTGATLCQEGPEATTVCHIPRPGRPDDVWWIGFDCAHAWDHKPGEISLFRSLHVGDDLLDLMERTAGHKRYRDLKYVMGEVADLAQQIAELVWTRCVATNRNRRRCRNRTRRVIDPGFPERFRLARERTEDPPEELPSGFLDLCPLHGNKALRLAHGEAR